ncbi:MAG: hypothetical protein HXS48_21625 [Theionarchaea archaeon]|nr:hypothetical protein [Theionarchaea archaeon]
MGNLHYRVFASTIEFSHGSLYTAITLHMTSNTLGQVLSFTNMLPEDNTQWLLLIGLSLVLIFIVLVIMERMKK